MFGIMSAKHGALCGFRTMEPAVRHFTTLHYTAGADRQKIIALHRALLDSLKSGDEIQSVAAVKALLQPGETALKTRIRSKRK